MTGVACQVGQQRAQLEQAAFKQHKLCCLLHVAFVKRTTPAQAVSPQVVHWACGRAVQSLREVGGACKESASMGRYLEICGSLRGCPAKLAPTACCLMFKPAAACWRTMAVTVHFAAAV